MLDMDSKNLHLISTGEYTPKLLAQSSSGVVYAAADLTSNAQHDHGAILGIDADSSAVVASADRFTSLSASGSNVLWTEASTDDTSTVVNIFHSNAGTTASMPGFHKSATVVGIDSTTAIVFTAGENEAYVLNAETIKVTGTILFPNPIAQFSNGLFALMDGSIGRADIRSDGAGSPVLVWTDLTKQRLVSLSGGFAMTAPQEGRRMLYLNPTVNNGTLPLAIPIQSAR